MTTQNMENKENVIDMKHVLSLAHLNIQTFLGRSDKKKISFPFCFLDGISNRQKCYKPDFLEIMTVPRFSGQLPVYVVMTVLGSSLTR